jgi:hypothetical protein
MKVAPKERIFLVGCARSGTTLLQSMLAAHPQIASFPESQFFMHLNPRYEPRRRALGLASQRARPELEKYLHEIGQEKMLQRLSRFAFFPSQYTKTFLEILDTLTAEQGKSLWVEKSPPHLHHIDFIEKLIPEAKFIHILRNGADVVASLYDATHKYPKSAWGNKPWSIDECIYLWLKGTQSSLSHQHKPNHILVKYEHLVEDPQSVLTELCRFIGVAFNEKMLREYSVAAKGVILKREPWKASVLNKIQNANSTKFYELFDEEQRQYILNRLSEVNVNTQPIQGV